MLRQILLALLSTGPAHGYALMKRHAGRTGIRLSIGNVYRELQRMMADGLIVAAPNPPGADVRRMPYEITEHGRDALAHWLATRTTSERGKTLEDLECRLAIVAAVDRDTAASELDRLRDELAAQARQLETEVRAAPVADVSEDRTLFPVRRALRMRWLSQLENDVQLVCELASQVRGGAAPARAARGVGGERKRATGRLRD